MKKLSTLLVVLLSLNLVVSAATDPDKKGGKTKKHVEHDLDFAHDVPMVSFYDLTVNNRDSTILAFSIIVDTTSAFLIDTVRYAKNPNRVRFGFYIYKKAKGCANATKAVTLQSWLDKYSNSKRRIQEYDLEGVPYRLYSFTTPFIEKKDDIRGENRRGIQFYSKSCVDKTQEQEEMELKLFRHDGSTIAHPKG